MRQLLAIVKIPAAATLLAIVALGATVVVFPAIAGSETTPTIDAIAQVSGEKEFAWSPEQVTVAAGTSVTFANTTPGVPHGIRWTSSTKPECSKSVPVDSEETEWSGTCTFSQPGTYTFMCTVHAYMVGKVVVNANGTTTTTTSTTTSTQTSGESTQPPSKENTQPESGSGSSSLLAGSAAKALTVAKRQHGTVVKGALELSKTGAGAHLTVELLAKGASKTKIGRLVRHSLRSGRATFAVKLNRAGRSELQRLHRLVVTAKITLAGGEGRVVILTRRVVMRL